MKNLLKIVLGLTLALALVVGVGAVRASAAGLGDSGAEVSALQADLISLGYSIPAGATGWYGEQTAAAVSAFQAAYASEILAPLGLTAPTGFAGTLTMAKIAALKAGGSPVVGTFPAGCTSSAGFSSTTGLPCSTVVTYPAGCTSSTGFSTTTGLPCSTVTTLPAGCTSTDGFSPTTGMPCSGSTTTTTTTTLGSGDGDITTVTETSSADSSVNEGESNEIFGFQAEIEGDVKIDRVDIYLESDSAASENANDYFQSATLKVDGKEVATLDVDDLTEDDYDIVTVNATDEFRARFTGLNLTYADGAKPKFILVMKGNSTIDSADQVTDWTSALDVNSIRFVDGKGFSSEEGASLTDTWGIEGEDVAELSINSVTADPDPKVIQTSTSDTTEHETVFVFGIEEKNNVDVTVKGLTVTVTSTVETDEAIVMTEAELFDGSTLLASESVPTGGVVVFEDFDVDIAGDATENLTVKLSFADQDDFAVGSTVTVAFTSIDEANDVNGNDESDMTITGTPASETHELRDTGVQVTFDSVSTSDVSIDGADNDRSELTIKFKVKAFGEDAYIPNVVTATDFSGPGPFIAPTTAEGVGYAVDTAGTDADATTVTATSISSTADEETASFLVIKDTTETFTLKVVVTNDGIPDLSGSYRAILTGVNFADTDTATGDAVYTLNLQNDFKTGYGIILD